MYLTNFNGTLLFAANDGTDGTELWRSDGTSAGTYMVKDIYAGVSGGNPTWLTVMNGAVYFSACDSTHGYELWKSDGTSSGTVWLRISIPEASVPAPPI